MISSFSLRSDRALFFDRYRRSFRPTSLSPSSTSATISGTSATASFDSEVKGMFVEAMWTRIAAGPVGTPPPGWVRE